MPQQVVVVRVNAGSTENLIANVLNCVWGPHQEVEEEILNAHDNCEIERARDFVTSCVIPELKAPSYAVVEWERLMRLARIPQ